MQYRVRVVLSSGPVETEPPESAALRKAKKKKETNKSLNGLRGLTMG